jgi:hypothetical protein
VGDVARSFCLKIWELVWIGCFLKVRLGIEAPTLLLPDLEKVASIGVAFFAFIDPKSDLFAGH